MATAYNRAYEAIRTIKRHRKRCLVVHYACQSLYDDREGLSPRISNIVVKDFENDQTVSFAAHLVAEELGYTKEEIEPHWIEIESKLLDDFFNFVRSKHGSYWLHWNMINIQYGFETLSHRYKILTGRSAPSIDIDFRINIASILSGKYGYEYVKVPHMPNLMELNGGVRRDFVKGADEVELFRNAEFARLHASTVSKVKFFAEVVELVLDGKLKTSRANFVVKVERWFDSVWMKGIGAIASLYALFDIASRILP